MPVASLFPNLSSIRRIPMMLAELTRWFLDAWGDLARYFGSMSTWQWGIASACVMVFSFMCLKGYKIDN